MLKGKIVKLRPYEREDIDSILEYLNDDEVSRFLMPGIPFPYSRDEEEAWFDSQKENKECKNFAIVNKETGEYYGGCGVNNIDWKNNICIIGLFLGKPHWSKGIGTDTLKVLCDFIFDQMNIRKISLNVYAFNERAIGCYKKMGFEVEGILKEQIFRDGKYHDELVMGYLRKNRKTD